MLSRAEDEALDEGRIDVAKDDATGELELAVERIRDEVEAGEALVGIGRLLTALEMLGVSSSLSDGQFVAVGKIEVTVRVPNCVCRTV